MGGAERRQRRPHRADRPAETRRVHRELERDQGAPGRRAGSHRVPLRAGERLRRRVAQHLHRRLAPPRLPRAQAGLHRPGVGQHAAGDHVHDGGLADQRAGGRPVHRRGDGGRPERRPDPLQPHGQQQAHQRQHRLLARPVHRDVPRPVLGHRAAADGRLEGLRLRLRRPGQRGHRAEVVPRRGPAGQRHQRRARQDDHRLVLPADRRRRSVPALQGDRRQPHHPVGERLE